MAQRSSSAGKARKGGISSIPDLVNDLIENRGISHDEVARTAGLTPNMLYRLRRGTRRSTSEARVVELAIKYGYPISEALLANAMGQLDAQARKRVQRVAATKPIAPWPVDEGNEQYAYSVISFNTQEYELLNNLDADGMESAVRANGLCNHLPPGTMQEKPGHLYYMVTSKSEERGLAFETVRLCHGSVVEVEYKRPEQIRGNPLVLAQIDKGAVDIYQYKRVIERGVIVEYFEPGENGGEEHLSILHERPETDAPLERRRVIVGVLRRVVDLKIPE